MADATLSGYKAAIATVAFTGTQQFTALTDNEWTDESDAIDNAANKYMFVDLEINLGSAAFTGTDSAIEIYLIPTIDGTNFGDWVGNVTTDEQENNAYFVGSVTTSGTTAAQRLILRGVALPNDEYKWGIRNRGNVTLNATNTLKWRPHQFASS